MSQPDKDTPTQSDYDEFLQNADRICKIYFDTKKKNLQDSHNLQLPDEDLRTMDMFSKTHRILSEFESQQRTGEEIITNCATAIVEHCLATDEKYAAAVFAALRKRADAYWAAELGHDTVSDSDPEATRSGGKLLAEDSKRYLESRTQLNDLQHKLETVGLDMDDRFRMDHIRETMSAYSDFIIEALASPNPHMARGFFEGLREQNAALHVPGGTEFKGSDRSEKNKGIEGEGKS